MKIILYIYIYHLFLFRCSGYNQKLEILLKKLLERMMTFCDEVDVDLFERIKDKVICIYTMCSIPCITLTACFR